MIDGFISIVAALCAARLCPAAAGYCFPSHASYERGYALAARELGLSPWLLLDMRLGEGSGCPLAFQVMAAACAAAKISYRSPSTNTASGLFSQNQRLNCWMV